MSGFFQKHENRTPGKIDKGQKRPDGKRYQGVNYVEDGTSLGYDVQSFRGEAATVVPLTAKFGGVPGKKSPYGEINGGSVITADYEGAGGEQAIGPVALPEQSYLDDDDHEEEDDFDLDAGEAPDELTQEIHSLMNEIDEMETTAEDYIPPEIPAAYPGVQAAIAQVAPMQQVAPIHVPRSEMKRVIFKGSFGTYRGNYSNIVVDPQFVVLLYSLDESVYSPPASAEHFSLACEASSYEVYFAGVEFVLEHIHRGVQVMIRVKS
jgi:hypothetical protein